MAKPAIYAIPGGVFSLSESGMQSLLRAVLTRNIPLRLKATGSSMSPFIQDGDAVIVSPLTDRKVRVGEVVAFCEPVTRKLILHRVVASLPDGYIIRGDNSLSTDGVVGLDHILGVVSSVQRNGKQVRFGFGPERRLIALLFHRETGRTLILRMCHFFSAFR